MSYALSATTDVGKPRRARRRVLRWIARFFMVVVGAAIAVALVLMGRTQYLERPIVGALQVDPALAEAPLVQAAGPFAVHWEPAGGGQMTVAHESAPDRVLWASVPGRAFAGAGEGEAQVREQHAHYFLSDRLERTCACQTMDGMAQEGEAVVVTGQLECSDGTRTGYRFRLAPQSEHRLGLELSVDDPTLNRTYLTYATDQDEHFFGFGEQYSYFDMKGRRLPLFVSEQGIGRGEQPITAGANFQAGAGGAWHSSYAGVPHYITSRLRSLYLENYEYTVFDLRNPLRVHVQLFAPRASGVIIAGESPAALIAEYTEATGRMRPLPDWILGGAVVGMQGGTERVREVLAQLDDLETPVAGFWLQDWVGQRTTSFGRQLWWNWELDRERYPGWEELVAALHTRDIRVLTYINTDLVDVSDKPGVRRNLFQEALEAGYLVRQADGQPYLPISTDFNYGMIDLTNPDARARLDHGCDPR